MSDASSAPLAATTLAAQAACPAPDNPYQGDLTLFISAFLLWLMVLILLVDGYRPDGQTPVGFVCGFLAMVGLTLLLIAVWIAV